MFKLVLALVFLTKLFKTSRFSASKSALLSQAFGIAEEQLGISPVMSGKEMATCEDVDKLLMVTYLSQVSNIVYVSTIMRSHIE